jgi:hypothetical protein
MMEKFVGGFESALARPGMPARFSWSVIPIAATVMIVVAAVFFPLPPIWGGLNDVLVLMDGGWRVFHGQVPHVDFNSALGPYPLGILGFAFVLTGGAGPNLALALGLVGGAFGLLAFVVLRERTASAVAVAFSLAVIAMVSAPVFLGGGEGPPAGFRFHTSYAMIYNRLGWAALLVAQCSLLVPRRVTQTRLGSRADFVDGAWGGLACGLAAFTKINFLVGALATATVALIVARQAARRSILTGIVAGATLALLLLAAWPGGVFRYFADLAGLWRVERTESYWGALHVRLGANAWWLLAMVALMAWALGGRRFPAGAEREETTWRDGFRFAAVVVIGLMVATFNYERAQLPALLVAALLLVEFAQRRFWPASSESSEPPAADALPRLVVIKLGALALAANYFVFDAGSLSYGLFWNLKNPRWDARSERLAGPRLARLPVPVHYDEPGAREAAESAILARDPLQDPKAFMTSRQLTRWINDGVELLARQRIEPDDRVFVADWFNPFNLALGIPPARGGALLWDYKRMVDERSHPDPERTMREITLLMVPKRPTLPAQTAFMLGVYASTLERDYALVGESSLWSLWRKNDGGTGKR